jgi:E3 ubiquitin-protein ligase RAD18
VVCSEISVGLSAAAIREPGTPVHESLKSRVYAWVFDARLIDCSIGSIDATRQRYSHPQPHPTSLMDSAFDVPDSTDWLNTPLAALADLESALHCQICKEFFDTPMITSCSHTFCSRCIRTSLSADGRCPACRASDQASKLRNNWQLQEVVSTFLVARPQAIKIAREERDKADDTKKSTKRKRAILESDQAAAVEKEGRTTRSKSRRTVASQGSQADVIQVDDSDEDASFEPDEPKDDGLVECPLGCGKRMKIESVEPHLDRCEDEKAAEKRAKSRTPVAGLSSSRTSTRSTPRIAPRPQDRISELNYSLLKEGPLRKKMDELGLPGFGSKQLMVRRHTEWVNLWNANCDSSNPRSKRELLQDLDTWERTQGGRAPVTNQGYGIMRKDFDGDGWANKNKVDFARLIADAKRKKATAAPEPDKKEGDEGPRAPESEQGRLPDAVAPLQAPINLVNHGQAAITPEPPVHWNGLQPHPTEAPDPKTGLDFLLNPISQAPIPPLVGTQAAAPSDPPQKDSREYHLNQQDGKEPCELPSHVASSSVRKVPMFSVPEEVSRDVVTGEGVAKD